MTEDLINDYKKIYLNFNPAKVRWLSESKITPTELFCIGAGENLKKVSLWRCETNSDRFEPRNLCDTSKLDGRITEIRAKSTEELFVSTSNGSVYYIKYLPTKQRLHELQKWSVIDEELAKTKNFNENEFVINDFDFDSGCDELCLVGENGEINFIRLAQTKLRSLFSNNYREYCSLNSVLYLKQYEIAVADCLGRVKLWDTRTSDNNKSNITFTIEGECAPIMCLAKHPNQQHIIACGNVNGLIAIYDVRSNNKPFILCHNHSEPVLEICFDPYSTDSLITSSIDGCLWLWNTKGESVSSWEDRVANARNFLPNNKYSINSFDINNDNILAVNDNLGLFKIKNHNLI